MTIANEDSRVRVATPGVVPSWGQVAMLFWFSMPAGFVYGWGVEA